MPRLPLLALQLHSCLALQSWWQGSYTPSALLPTLVSSSSHTLEFLLCVPPEKRINLPKHACFFPSPCSSPKLHRQSTVKTGPAHEWCPAEDRGPQLGCGNQGCNQPWEQAKLLPYALAWDLCLLVLHLTLSHSFCSDIFVGPLKHASFSKKTLKNKLRYLRKR